MAKKIKSAQRKSVKISRKPSKRKKAKKSGRKAPSLKLKSKFRKVAKAIARKAVLKAVAKKKLIKHSKIQKKQSKALSKISKKAAKPIKMVARRPKIKEEKEDIPQILKKYAEVNQEDVSRILSEAYTRHLIIEAAGEHALEIVRRFSNNSSDEDISKKLKIKISDVRAALNKLHSLGIVEYSRQKNSETGWFHYFWYLNVDKMNNWVNARIEKESHANDFKEGEHYFCPRCGGVAIYEFASATDMGFRCPTCTTSLEFLSEEKSKELFPVRPFRKPTL
jgi:transcription factor E